MFPLDGNKEQQSIQATNTTNTTKSDAFISWGAPIGGSELVLRNASQSETKKILVKVRGVVNLT